jgi:hypothetical protein
MSGEDLGDTSANDGRLLWIVRESLEQKVFLARNTYSIRLGEAKSRESTPWGKTAAAIIQLLPLFRATLFIFQSLF